MAKTNLTAQRLRELLHYDPETGVFTYRVKRGICMPGNEAGCPMKRGNHSIGLEYGRYATHRLAWLYMTGEWPTKEIDHLDGNPLNNRWDNLRLATSAENKQNQRRPKVTNKCGFLGVCRHPIDKQGLPTWRARIQIDGKSIHVGLFNTPEEAHAAYVDAKRRLHPFGVL